MSFNGTLSQKSKYALEDFKNQFEKSQLVSMVQTLIWSVTDPSKAAIGIDKNLFTLYQREKANDCQSTLSFGFRTLEQLRKARPAIDFYYSTQVLSEAPIKWEKEMHKVLENVYLQAQECLKNSMFYAGSDLNDWINNKSPSNVATTLESKYFTNDYFVVKLDGTDQVKHHGIFDPKDNVIVKAQGNDKKMIAVQRPKSR